MAVFEITAPDGNTYEITAPDGASEQDVLSYAQQNYQGASQPQQPAQAPQEQSFLSQLGNSLSQRGDQFSTAFNAGRMGQQGNLETIGQLLGVGAGAAGDVLGQGIAAITPDAIKQPLAQAAQFVGSQPLVQDAVSGYQQFAQENPRSDRNLSALANVAGILPLGTAPARAGIGAAADVVAPVAKAAGNVATAPVRGLASGVKTVAEGIGARGTEALDAAQDALYAEGSASYKQMKDIGAAFKPEATEKLVGKVGSAFKDEILHPVLHSRTLGLVDSMNKDIAENGLSLERLDQWRKTLGRVPFSDPEDYRTAKIAVRSIDDFIDNLSPDDLSAGGTEAASALKNARKEWGRASRFEQVADIVRKSDGDANYVKRELKKILDNPAKTRGYSKDELRALKEAATLSGGEAILKIVGKFGFDPARLGSGAGALLGSGAGGAALGASGAIVVPAVGTAARYGQKGLVRGKTERLLKTIEKGNNP